MDAVGDILAQRQQDRLAWGPATVLAFFLHVGILVLLLLSVMSRPMHYAAPRAVAVRLLSAGSLR